MIRFRTELKPEATPGIITRHTPLLTLGSCFADEIGSRLCTDGFDCVANPAGPLYNPLSLLQYLQWCLSGDEVPVWWLRQYPNGGAWHSWLHYTKITADSRDALIAKIQQGAAAVRRQLQQPGAVLFVTLGGTRVFALADDADRVVANCHKYAPRNFVERDMPLDEVCRAVCQIAECAPVGGRVVFTVSPVRHLYANGGMHGNTLAKAKLHLAAEQAVKQCGAMYFSAYEALNDDLRDYRYYADDMLHPSATAVEYVYDLLQQTYMDAATRQYAADAHRLAQLRAHRPADPQAHAAAVARAQAAFVAKYPR